MGDITDQKRSSPVQLVGGGSDNEGYISNVTPLKEASTSDILNNGGLDAELTVGISAVELKVGASRKANRKYVIFQALDQNIKFGFTSLTQNIPCQKHRVFMLPVGENTEVWFIATEAGKKVAIGEL